MASGNAGSVRVDSLTKAGLKTMETHERRLDRTGARRSVRKDAEGKPIPALIYDPYGTGTGEGCLVDALAKHVEGARINKAAENVARHAFIQFPVGLDVTPETEKMMLQKAVEFVNKTHGGNAVFRGRLDRDEMGRHGVDVFFAPKYTKTTKRGSTKWVSLTKFGKELAAERFGQKPKTVAKKNEDTGEVTWEPVLDENGKAVKVDCDSKWYQGRALQDEWFEFLRDDVGLDWVVRGDPKIGSDPDRLEPEVFGLRKDLDRLHSSHLDTLENLERDLTAEIAEREAKLLQREAEIERDRKRAYNRAMKEIEERRAEVTTREKAVQEAEERVAALDAREKELEERESKVAKQIAALDAREKEVSERETKTADAEQRVQTLDAKADELFAEVEELGAKKAAFRTNYVFINHLAEAVSFIVDKFRKREIEASVWDTAARIEEYLEKTIRDMEAEVPEHFPVALEGLKRVNQDIKDAQERLQAVEKAEARLKPLQASEEALRTSEAALRASVEGLEAQKEELEANLAARTKSVEAREKSIETWKAQNLSAREVFFENGFTVLVRAIRKYFDTGSVSQIEQAYKKELAATASPSPAPQNLTNNNFTP